MTDRDEEKGFSNYKARWSKKSRALAAKNHFHGSAGESKKENEDVFSCLELIVAVKNHTGGSWKRMGKTGRKREKGMRGHQLRKQLYSAWLRKGCLERERAGEEKCALKSNRNLLTTRDSGSRDIKI